MEKVNIQEIGRGAVDHYLWCSCMQCSLLFCQVFFWKYMREAEHSERPFSTLETRSRTSSFQSHASRRDREFLPFSLMIRDEIENFCLSVSCFEKRMRIWFELIWIHLAIEGGKCPLSVLPAQYGWRVKGDIIWHKNKCALVSRRAIGQ